MSSNFLLHSHRHVSAILKPVADRYEQEELLQAAIKENPICHNSRSTDLTGENAIECRQKGPFCLNEECGMCEQCSLDYACPNAERHDFGERDV